jgi:NAD-dependent SIR2 family protein deacetylase
MTKDETDLPAAGLATGVERALDAAAGLVAQAGALLVCAGAGMGVDSGLPDFRGNAGFWRAYPPYAALGLSFAEMANPSHFASDPDLAWGFYGHRLALYRSTVPHAGFGILRRWGERLPGGVQVFTSNVDGQFQKAGFTGVTEVHGSIHHLQCVEPCGDEVWQAGDLEVTVDEVTMRAREPLPACPHCGGLARPNILMFGDWRWIGGPSDAQERGLAGWLRAARSGGWGRPVVIELGAGKAVPTVRITAEQSAGRLDAARAGAGRGAVNGSLIRINPDPAAVGVPPGAGISVCQGALAALSAIDARLA